MQRLPVVVIIEPEWPARSYMRAELEELGYTVTAHERVEEAMKYLLRWGFHPDVIVVDLAHNGTQEQQLKALLEAHPQAALIVLGSALRELQPSLRSRAIRFLRRPLAIHDVVAAVCEVTPPPFNLR